MDGKIIFTGYGEVIILNFSVMGNAIFFLSKKLMERWYLLGLGLFELSMNFQDDLGNTAFLAETTNINGLNSLLSMKSLFLTLNNTKNTPKTIFRIDIFFLKDTHANRLSTFTIFRIFLKAPTLKV